MAVAVTTAMEISASEVQYNTREDNTRQYEIDCAEGAGRGAGGGGAGAGVNPRGARARAQGSTRAGRITTIEIDCAGRQVHP